MKKKVQLLFDIPLNLLEPRLLLQKDAVRGCASGDKEVFPRAVRYFSPSRKLTMSREPRSQVSPLRSWFHHWCWLDWACWCWSCVFHRWCGWCQVVENGTVDSTPGIRARDRVKSSIVLAHTLRLATAPSFAACPAHSAACMGALDEGLLPPKKAWCAAGVLMNIPCAHVQTWLAAVSSVCIE